MEAGTENLEEKMKSIKRVQPDQENKSEVRSFDAIVWMTSHQMLSQLPYKILKAPRGSQCDQVKGVLSGSWKQGIVIATTGIRFPWVTCIPLMVSMHLQWDSGNHHSH